MNGQTLTFSENDLALSAAAYDATRAPAWLVLGHPNTDDPVTLKGGVLGKVVGLFAKDGALYAEPVSFSVCQRS